MRSKKTAVMVVMAVMPARVGNAKRAISISIGIGEKRSIESITTSWMVR